MAGPELPPSPCGPVPASGVPLGADSQALFDGAAQARENRQAIIDFTTGNRQPKSWLEQLPGCELTVIPNAGH